MDHSHLTFATAIGSRHVRGDWRGRLTDELAARDVRLDGDELWAGPQMLGFHRLVELRDLRDTPHGDAWAARGERPWAGSPIGVVEWTHVVSEADSLSQFVPALIELGRGPFVRLDGTGGTLESLTLRRFPLAHLLSRRGFDDGAALLPDPDYLDDARARAERALREAGFDGDVGTWEHGNRLRIAGSLRRDGRPLDEDQAEAALAGHAFELWSFDRSITAHPTFWRD